MTSALAPLTGYTVGITAGRRGADQVELFERQGATVVFAPALRILPADDESLLLAQIERFIAKPPTYLIVAAATGVRRWIEFAEAAGLVDELLAAVEATALVAVGQDAAGAAVTEGLTVAWAVVEGPRMAVISSFNTRIDSSVLASATVAVLVDGDGSVDLVNQMGAKASEIVAIHTHRWAMPENVESLERLARSIAENRIDMVTFSSAPAVANLLSVARAIGVGEEMVVALSSTVVPIAAGDATVDALRDLGVAQPLQPPRPRLGWIVQTASAYFTARRHEVVLAGINVVVQGRAVEVEGEVTMLSDRERAVLDELLVRPGVVLSKAELLRRVWRGTEADEHLVEVTVARLRQRLGAASQGVETVMRRGYRISDR